MQRLPACVCVCGKPAHISGAFPLHDKKDLSSCKLSAFSHACACPGNSPGPCHNGRWIIAICQPLVMPLVRLCHSCLGEILLRMLSGRICDTTQAPAYIWSKAAHVFNRPKVCAHQNNRSHDLHIRNLVALNAKKEIARTQASLNDSDHTIHTFMIL